MSRGGFAKRVTITTPPPWRSWRKTSKHGRAIRFIESYCRAPKGVGWGKTLKLADWQKVQLEEVLANGIESAVRSFPRGNGKSTFEAAIGVWAAFDEGAGGAPQVPIIATTVSQAIRSVYGVARAMVLAETELAGRSLDFTGTGTSRISVPYNNGELFPMANDLDGLQGLDPTLAIADEIGFQPLEAWDALLLAGGKRPASLVLGMGTPGISHDNALFHLRKLVSEGAVLPGFNFREWAADENCAIDDRAQWSKANPALGSGFLQESALVNSLGLVPESEFRIFRLGQWVEGIESWLGSDGKSVWDKLERPWEFIEKGPTWVGVDAAITRDTTAVVSVQAREPDILHAKARIWVPKKDEPVDLTDVMGYIRELTKTYQVGAVAFDPRFMDWPSKVLYDEGIPMVEIPQSVERMTAAIGDLYTMIREGKITHDKDDRFTSHVLNAVVRLNERGFTLSKGKSRGHIDAVIALAMAVDRARNKKKPRAPLVML